ncbi:hypothetical protein [Geodermatophilus africanus]|uniref:hypothetical protein n=1 Tax=Geodermatophilus africanus TaxID=1137993 RepID=UPI0011150407|nr:hypothetical protein [Geodermatophilus africanus]
MIDLDPIAISVVAAILGGLGSLVTGFISDRHSRNTRSISVEGELRQVNAALDRTAIDALRSDSLARAAEALATTTEAPTVLVASREQPKADVESAVQRHVDSAVESLQVRIRTIEERFPAQSEIDKIASVNAAIAATKIEALQDSIKRLEAKIEPRLLRRLANGTLQLS